MTSRPDRVVELLLALCEKCSGSLVEHAGEAAMERRQVLDPPPPSGLETTEYRAISLRCSECGEVTKPAFPQWAKAPVQYGPRMHAMTNYLAVRQYMHQWSGGMAYLLREMPAKRNAAMEPGRTELEPDQVAAFEDAYDRVTREGWQENRRRKGKRQGSKAANLLLRLEEHRDEVLRFLHDLAVPFTNNEIEDDLRMTKLHEKISGGWRSMDGARAFLAVRSYLATARKQGQGILDVLIAAFENRAWMPAAPAPETAGYIRSMGRNARRRSQARQNSAGPSRPADSTPNDHPRLPPNAIETLVALVTAGELDSELHLLYNTIGDRIEAIESARLANALARLGIGDWVRIGHDVRPGYLHGLPDTVIRRGTETITIRLDRPVGKYVDGCIRCSALAVKKICT